VFGCPPLTPELLLAMVALINAVGGVAALVIHSLRVPYRESAAVEQLHAREQLVGWRAGGRRISDVPEQHTPGEPPPMPPASNLS
jgi:hypothetical protein